MLVFNIICILYCTTVDIFLLFFLLVFVFICVFYIKLFIFATPTTEIHLYSGKVRKRLNVVTKKQHILYFSFLYTFFFCYVLLHIFYGGFWIIKRESIVWYSSKILVSLLLFSFLCFDHDKEVHHRIRYGWDVVRLLFARERAYSSAMQFCTFMLHV